MRAQSGIELATFVGFLILVLMAFSALSMQRQNEVVRARGYIEAQRVSDLVAAHISIASSVGDGYSANFTLPLDLAGQPYFVVAFPSEERVAVVWGPQNASYSSPVTTTNFQFNSFNVSQPYVPVRNVGGMVYVG